MYVYVCVCMYVPHKVWVGYRRVGNPMNIVIKTLVGGGFLGRQPGTARFKMYVPHKVLFGYRWVGNPIKYRDTYLGRISLSRQTCVVCVTGQEWNLTQERGQ